MKKRNRRAAFTLMEVLLVLVILVILGSLVGVAIRQQQKKALVNAAKAQIEMLEQSVKSYELEIRSFPSTSQGLEALVQRPSDLRNPDRWQGGYLDATQVPLDPWDNPYQYEQVDTETFRIWSWGPDGASGTDDDISNR